MRPSIAGRVLRSNVPRGFRREPLNECTIHLPASGWPNMQSMSVALALLWRAVLFRSASGAFGMCRCWLIALTKACKNWGFRLCYLYLRNIKGFKWNHKRVRRIYCDLELNPRIKPRKRLKPERPDPLSVPDQPN